jgi:hypothetical protein
VKSFITIQNKYNIKGRYSKDSGPFYAIHFSFVTNNTETLNKNHTEEIHISNVLIYNRWISVARYLIGSSTIIQSKRVHAIANGMMAIRIWAFLNLFLITT